jgi:hypothetical protein
MMGLLTLLLLLSLPTLKRWLRDKCERDKLAMRRLLT